MYNMPVWYIGNFELPVHWVLMLLCCLAALGLALLQRSRHGMRAKTVCLYAALAAALGFLLGRIIYCAVCWVDVFQDEMGEFAGVLPFFNPTVGSVNVMGFVFGLLLASPIAGRLTGTKSAVLLDAAAVPALVLYILARAIEPLSGQGYGDLMGMEVCVSWLEAALTAILLALTPFLRRKSRQPGTFVQAVLILWCLLQILPESLRLDSALYVLVFARVTHLGLAFTLGLTHLRLLAAGRRTIVPRAILLDVLGLAAGIGLCIGTLFALDKTNWPKPLVYGLMILALAELGFVILRRVHRQDIAPDQQ